MKPSIEYASEFHQKYACETHDQPHISNEALNNLRLSLLKEELGELEEALKNRDKTKVLDALTDLQYVLDGAYLALGFHHLKDAALEEVHRSNLSKLGEDGKPIRRADGKVLKGPNYFAPNLSQFVS